MNKVYPLPLSPTYVRHWGVVEAVRELIQNAIDSDAEFEYALLDDAVVLRSRGVTLDASTLVLGNTTKAEDADKIGSFGEGYKIALLVLTRLGRQTVVVNGSVTWTPEFRESEVFGSTLLHIVEATRENPGSDLEFRISGLSQVEMDAITYSCLLMQPPMDDAMAVPQGRILPSKPGRLYVGGLFVCETELEFGYDIHPRLIRLERDRQTVSDWDLKSITRDMWIATGQHDRVAEMIARECPDTAYVQYGGATDLVKEACYRHFMAKHPGGIVARTHAEMEAMVAKGLTKVIVAGGSYYAAVSAAPSYARHAAQVVKVLTPHQELTEFFDHYGKRMPRLPKVAMKRMIERSQNWKVA